MNNLISETDSIYRASLKTIQILMNCPETIFDAEQQLNKLFGLILMIPGDPNVSGFKLLEENLEMIESIIW